MTTDVKAIEKLLTLPADWHWGEFLNQDKKTIRYGWNCPEHAKALIVIAEGRTEAIEEYSETIRDWNEQGYACAIMDWQGQGLSYRYFNDNTRQHSEGFDRDVADFSLFIDLLKQQDAITSLPKILFGHSMGGNLGLRYLADHTGEFKCAVLSAPMLGLNPKRIIKYAANPILRAMTRFNRLDRHAFTQTRWHEAFANIAKFKVSSDPLRHEVQPYLFKTRPDLQCGGVTFGWLEEALKSIDILHDPDYCKRITTPVFIGVGGKDIVVDNSGSYLTASLLPHCTIQLFEGSEHQIHREKDAIRDQFMHAFQYFVEKYL